MGNVPIAASGALLESPSSSASPKSDSAGGFGVPMRQPMPVNQPYAQQLGASYSTHFPREGEVLTNLPYEHPHNHAGPKHRFPMQQLPPTLGKPMTMHQPPYPMGPNTLARLRAVSLTPSPTPSKKKSKMLTGTFGRIFKRGGASSSAASSDAQGSLPKSPLGSASPSLGIAYNQSGTMKADLDSQYQRHQKLQQQQHMQFLRHKEMQQQHLYQLAQQQQHTQQPYQSDQHISYGNCCSFYQKLCSEAGK